MSSIAEMRQSLQHLGCTEDKIRACLRATQANIYFLQEWVHSALDDWDREHEIEPIEEPTLDERLSMHKLGSFERLIDEWHRAILIGTARRCDRAPHDVVIYIIEQGIEQSLGKHARRPRVRTARSRSQSSGEPITKLTNREKTKLRRITGLEEI